MDAVAAEAGVTKPVLYRYFSDKAALVEALGECGLVLLGRLLPAINSDGPALARIRDAIGAYFAVIDEYPNLYWLLARRSADAADAVDPVHHDKELIAGSSPRSSATTCAPTASTPARPNPGDTASPGWCRAPANGG